MRQPWGRGGVVAPFCLALGAPLGLGLGVPLGLGLEALFRLGLGVPLGWGRGWKRDDMDDFGTDLGEIPRGGGGILHCRRKIFSIVVSVLFRGKCVQL